MIDIPYTVQAQSLDTLSYAFFSFLIFTTLHSEDTKDNNYEPDIIVIQHVSILKILKIKHDYSRDNFIFHFNSRWMFECTANIKTITFY